MNYKFLMTTAIAGLFTAGHAFAQTQDTQAQQPGQQQTQQQTQQQPGQAGQEQAGQQQAQQPGEQQPGQQQAQQPGQQPGQPGQQQAQQPGQQQEQTAQQVDQQAEEQGTEIYVASSTVRDIQQALNQRGFSVENVDGTWNESTQQAMRNFQESEGLAATGTLTIASLGALDMMDALRGGGAGAQQPGQQQAGQQQAGQQQAGQQDQQEMGAQIHVGPEHIRQIQQALNERGFGVENVNGEWDDSTQQAAQNFQQAEGLQQSENLNVSLIAALGLSDQVFQGRPGQAAGQPGQQQAQQPGQQQPGQAGQQQAGQQQAGQQQAAQQGEEMEGTPLFLGPDGIRQVKQSLNQRGFNAGHVDGDWGDEAQQALRNFQTAEGLEASGQITGQTLASLGMNQWMQGQFDGQGVAGGAAPAATEATGAIGTTAPAAPAPAQPAPASPGVTTTQPDVQIVPARPQ